MRPKMALKTEWSQLHIPTEHIPPVTARSGGAVGDVDVALRRAAVERSGEGDVLAADRERGLDALCAPQKAKSANVHRSIPAPRISARR